MGFGTLEAAVSGLRAHDSWLQVIGNNLANMNTPGYKRSRVHFASLLEWAPDAVCGGKVLPLGVRVADTPRVFSQGPLVSTSRPLDLALQGEGFFAVNVGGEELYTRDGAFDIDKNGTLRHLASGGEVVDTNGRPIQAPVTMILPPEATTQIDVVGNFDASASGPTREVLASRSPFTTTTGARATTGTALNTLSTNTAAYEDGDTITISGKDRDGTTRSAVFVYGQNRQGTTMGDMVNFINSAFSGATATLENGNLVFSADATGKANLALTLEDGLTKVDGRPQSGATRFQDHSLQESIAGTDPATFNASAEVFDARGDAHQLNLTFTKAGADIWNMTASMDGATFADNQATGIRFNPDGSFSGVTGTGNGDTNITFQLPNNAPMTIDLNFGQPGSFSGTTQFGGFSDASAQNQNGSPPGYFDHVAFDSEGHVVVGFTNGQERDVAQLKVVNFPNQEALLGATNNLFRKSADTGEPFQGALGRGGTSVMQHYLEMSNVDQTQELTDMIMAQNGFAANARSISVSQQLFDIVSSLIR